MSNKVVFAAAGNGKTYTICKQARENILKTDKSILMITYTNEGVKTLENEYRKQNLGVIDNNIIIKTWYSFLLSEIIKPYQCLLRLKYKNYKTDLDISVPENFIQSIDFYSNEKAPRWYSDRHIQYYLNSARDIRKDNVSKLGCCCIEHSDNAVLSRLEIIYDKIYIDELQDYAGWDLEIFKYLFSTNIDIYCVGDYKQATFRTNNSSYNSKYRDDKIRDYFEMLNKEKYCDIEYSNSTRRFNKEICDFVNKIYNDQNSYIYPCNDQSSTNVENIGVYIIDNKHLRAYCDYYSPTILRYNCKSRVPFEHSCDVFNYGNSKGATFDRIIIIPVNTVKPFIQNNMTIESAQTRSKFFVACTRAKHSVVFAIDHFAGNDNFKPVEINIGENVIPAHKFMI